MADEPTPLEFPDDDVPRYYANWVTPVANMLDLELNVGHASGGESQPRWSCVVAMSWEEAVVLHEMLGSRIAHYEEHVDSIRRFKDPVAFPDFEDDQGEEDPED